MLMFILLSQSSQAQFYTGNDLREPLIEYRKAERSDRNTDYNKAWAFRGYVYGVYDATFELYCTPNNFTGHQLMAIVSNHIEENPQKWSLPARTLVRTAIISAFPCE